jgi:hypothetical protein
MGLSVAKQRNLVNGYGGANHVPLIVNVRGGISSFMRQGFSKFFVAMGGREGHGFILNHAGIGRGFALPDLAICLRFEQVSHFAGAGGSDA